TPDGTKILIANEGEPSDDYTIDPEGSVTIIDISSGVMSAVTTHITFESFNDQYDALKEEGVRLFGPNASVAQDLEPEFIAFGFDGETALVSCQENNALIGIDLNTNTILGIGALGEKDWSQIPNAFDSSNKSPDVFFANWNVKSFYQPDAIATYEVNGETYIITANEGDARDYDGYSEEERVDDLVLDPTVYPDAKYLQNDVLLGRLKTTTVNGDTDGDGDIDQIYAYGGRSFSIWNATTQQLIWDSGDQLERITQNDPVFGQIFNTTDDENEARNRSDDKGPEPEAVAIGEIDGRFYAFIGLERIGGIMLYEVTDPTNPTFIQYINTRQVEELGGDLAPEGLAYISADESPNGKPLLAVSYEVSGTIGMFEIETQCEIELGDDVTICENEFAELKADDNFMGYVWSTGETTQIINVNSTGTYEVSGITDYGCEATDQIEVTVLDTLTLNLGNDITICEDEIVTLEGPIGGITYLWSTGVFSQDLDVIDAGVYGLTVKNNDGCRSQDEIEVFVNPIPTVDIGNDTLVCEVAGPFVLNAGSDLMYFWNTGEVTQSIEVTQTGNYEVTVENEFGCEAEDEILVIVENCVGTTEAILDGDLNIYPNPTSGFLNIEMNDFEEGEYKMEVLDLTGRIIENESITVFGDYNTSLDLQSLSGGTYLLKIKSENGILVRRLMVLP
ncbi:T9SS type A sorting domain-containing protein, partial [Saprospiraceae bacterium]|nr:T9SS type A sorting domain-containing protein [Saprospiraceae bacterium]